MITGSPIIKQSEGIDQPDTGTVSASEKFQGAATAKNPTVGEYGKLPLSFESNQGQADRNVDFLARGSGYSLSLASTHATFLLSRQSSSGAERQSDRSFEINTKKNSDSKRLAILRMQVVGGNANAEARGLDELAGKVNYFIGNDASKWHTDVSTFERVRYREVYSGIDLVYYGNQRQLEYDFIVAPKADYKQIKLDFKGAKQVEIEPGSGDLLLHTRLGTMREHQPIVYQDINGEKREIASRYVKRGSEIGFEVSEYDTSRPLVIDPTLVYSTYLGGSGSDTGASIAVDSSGNAYITGDTNSTDFPMVSAIQGTYGGGALDAFVTKINSNGTALVYSTYLGGSLRDFTDAIAVDASGNAYLTGLTLSTNFPTVNALQSTLGGSLDAIVTKINAGGSALVYSTYLGGSTADRGNGIAVDSSGNTYITGLTFSSNFPTQNPFQAGNGGGRDAFVTKIFDPAGPMPTPTPTPQADLAITNTDGVASAVPGGTVIYVITVSNNGPLAANGASVTDTFPAFISSDSWICAGLGGGTCAASGNGNINQTVNLPVGGSVTFTVTANVSPDGTGTLFNTATVTAPGGLTDPDTVNNSATDSDALSPRADLAISKTDNSTTVAPGGTTVYMIVATNNGPSSAIGAIVNDTLPPQITSATWVCNAAGATCTASGTGSINDTVYISVGGSVTYTLTATVAAGGSGTLSNTATVTAPAGLTDPSPGNNSMTDTDTFVISIGGTIRDYVPSGANISLSSVTVTLTGTSGGTTTTDANGNYLFANKPSGGNYTVTPTAVGKVFEPASRGYTRVLANVTGADFIAYNLGSIPRGLKVINTIATPGQSISVPIVLTSQGNETSVAFSLNYDTNPFGSTPTARCGSSAVGCTITFNNSTPGKIGVTVTQAAQFATGPREIARVTFQSLATALSNTPVIFGDLPIARSIIGQGTGPLPSIYTNGAVIFAQGLEGDAADRNTGDGRLLANDVVQVRRFVVGTDTPNEMFNEFQRADTTPANTKGDGQLDATDIVQARRFASGLDAPVSAGGPGGPASQILTLPFFIKDSLVQMATSRKMRIVSAKASPGSKTTVSIEMNTQGDETAASFTLNFDPAKLGNPVVMLGPDAPAGMVLTANTKNADSGRIMILIDAADPFEKGNMAKRFVTITFDVSANAESGETPITFGNAPTPGCIADNAGRVLLTVFKEGLVMISE